VSRRGYSLTELLVVMGLTSVVLTVGLGMVHRVMHEYRSADREIAMHRVAQRLSTTLRADVHLASRAKLIQAGDTGGQRLVLNQPGENVVTYAVRENVLERTSVREGEPTHRDSFRFAEDYRLQFFPVSDRRVTFTAFALPQMHRSMTNDESPAEELKNDDGRAVMQVDATVGRDHRFAKKGISKKPLPSPRLRGEGPGVRGPGTGE
jgi:prepilin-type N-terminal cleavage/methylation domain-containing protein